MKIPIFLSVLLFVFHVNAQIITLNPSNPAPDEEIILTYDATSGNQELIDASTDVYAYTGLITSESTNDTDWKYVKAGWCENHPDLLMDRMDANTYQMRFVIRDFYNIPENVIVRKLAFLFRNEDCSKVGRDVDNQDIIYDLATGISGAYDNHTFSDNVLSIFDTEGNQTQIVPFSEDIIRVSYIPEGTVNDTSYSVVMQQDPDVTATLSDNTSDLTLQIDDMELVIIKENIEIEYYHEAEMILKETGVEVTTGAKSIYFEVDETEAFYGTGSRAISMNRNNRVLSFYNQPRYGYGWGADALNITIPFVMSSKKYGLFFDNHMPASMDINQTSPGQLAYFMEDGPARYWLIARDNYDEVVKDFVKMTGYQPLPPRWALGYIQSRYGYESESQARDIVNSMLANNFPIDALVLDLYWFGDPSTMGNLNWDNGRFPDPVSMMSDFKAEGVETILITEPYFTQNSTNYDYLDNVGFFGKNAQNETYELNNFWAGTAALLDIFNLNAQEWFWDFYEARYNEGASGWWCDLGEPELHPDDMQHINGTAREVHNIYSMEWARLIYDKTLEMAPNDRLFNLIRSGYAGMQRYSTFPWSGDVQRSFEGLQAQIPIMLGMATCGIGYMSSDLGGFTGSLNSELYTRWMQLGAFTPIMRPHGVGDPPEPIFQDVATQNIVRSYISMRHEMLPYTYTLAYQNSTTGEPIVKAINFYDDSDIQEEYLNSQFLFGNDVLIAPVMTQGAAQRNVYLPQGKWIHAFTGFSYSGGATYGVSAPIDEIPVFIKAGSIIPMVKPFLTMKDYATDSLIIHYYPDASVASSVFNMYNDDGTSKNYLNNESEVLAFAADFVDSSITITMEKQGMYNEFEGNRILEFALHRSHLPEEVLYNQVPLTISNEADYTNASNTYFYHDQDKILYIKVIWDHEPSEIEIENIHIISGNSEILAGLQPEITTYPNPVKDQLLVSIDHVHTRDLTLLIYNTLGNIIKVHSVFDSGTGIHEKIDFSGYDPGVYFIRVVGVDWNQTVKIIKR